MADISFSNTTKTGLLSRLFSSIARGFVLCADAHARVGQFERLNALSDADLAARGLSRKDIPRYVYRDMIGL